MTQQISVWQAHKIYRSDDTPNETHTWEHPETHGGLLLGGCPTCGKHQTRETYVVGFWQQNIELYTSYTCYGIAQCACGQWVKWCS